MSLLPALCGPLGAGSGLGLGPGSGSFLGPSLVGNEGAAASEPGPRARRRDCAIVMAALVNLHLDQRDQHLACGLLTDLAQAHPAEAAYHWALVRAHVSFGAVEQAEATLRHCEAAFLAGPNDAGLAAGPANMHRALVCMLKADYRTALGLFREVLAVQPGHLVAATNLAVCLLYARDLPGAIKVPPPRLV